MDQFDIIGALKTYAENLGMVFIWQYDTFYSNLTSNQQYNTGQLIMVVDLKPTPQIVGLKVSEIVYNGLFMIGRKFDSNGQQVSLDETQIQKYDRRLLTLTTNLITHTTTFACNNELTLEVGQIDYLFNTFDSNIDFVAAQSITFTS